MSEADASNPAPESVSAAMQAVLDSGVIGERSRLRRLLRYLVAEELAGRGEALKAYSIGVDVLDRPADFDPNSDSVVRVEANRLRGLLRDYYEGKGAGDPVVITLPVGRYRPIFLERDAPPESPPKTELEAAPAPVATAALGTGRRFMAAAVAVLAICGAVLWFLADDVLGPELYFGETSVEREPPMIEVEPIRDILRSKDYGYIADGVRSLLVADLSQMRTLRVRLGPAAPELASPADFTLSGYVTQPGDSFRLHLTLTDARTHEALWSVDRPLPLDHSGLRREFVNRIHAIVGELASPSGALMAEEIRRMEADNWDDADGGAYVCLLRWHAYDLSKGEAHRQAARDCLSRHVAAGSDSGALWAAHALMTFLDGADGAPGATPDFREKALAIVEQAIRLDPLGADGHEYKGGILLAMGRIEEAKQSFERAIEYNPSKPDLHVQRGWTLIRQGNWAAGIAEIQSGVALSPAPPGWFRIPLSMSAFREGDYETAFLEADLVWNAGDKRGAPLALAAAIKLGDRDRIAKYAPLAAEAGPDPIAAVEAVLDAPDLIRTYRETLGAGLGQ